jgi:4-aminobutyrate--pyruvate transaminase
VALKTLEIYERDNIFGHAAEMSDKFQKRLHALSDHPLVGEARGIGMIGAVELVSDKASKAMFPTFGKAGMQVAKACHENGLIIRNIGDTIGFCPPLIITSEQIDEMFDKFEKAMVSVLDWATREGFVNV